MGGRPWRGCHGPCHGYTVWNRDREVIESAILSLTARRAIRIRYLLPGGLCGQTCNRYPIRFLIERLPQTIAIAVRHGQAIQFAAGSYLGAGHEDEAQ